MKYYFSGYLITMIVLSIFFNGAANAVDTLLSISGEVVRSSCELNSPHIALPDVGKMEFRKQAQDSETYTYPNSFKISLLKNCSPGEEVKLDYSSIAVNEGTSGINYICLPLSNNCSIYPSSDSLTADESGFLTISSEVHLLMQVPDSELAGTLFSNLPITISYN